MSSSDDSGYESPAEEEIENSESTSSDEEGDVQVKVVEVKKEEPEKKKPIIRSIPNEPPPQYGQFHAHKEPPAEIVEADYDDLPPAYNPFSSNILTESQFQTVTNSLEVTKDLQSRSELTNTQHQRLKVALGNIKQIQRKLIQIIQNYANNPEICENLINILDQINVALQNDDSEDEKEEKEELIQDYKNILALSQFMISDPDNQNQLVADEEFARRLQEELNREDNNINNIDVSVYDDIPEPPPLPNSTPEDIAKAKAEATLLSLLQEKPNLKDEYIINPFGTSPGEGEKITLKSVFLPTTFTFYTTKDAPQSNVVQYFEIEIDEISPFFKFPFSFILSQDGESETIEKVSNLPINQLLEQLRPWGAAITQKHAITHSVKGKTLESGDVVGVGYIKLIDSYCLFLTQNGKWIDCALFDHPLNINNAKEYPLFKVILTTSAIQRTEQMKIIYNDGEKRPFKFNIKETMNTTEECSICFDEVFSPLMVELGCHHRFCRTCFKGYLETALQDGTVIDTNCPDQTCKTPVSDLDILQVLTALQLGKFKQYRILAQLRMNPNTKYCPNPSCTVPGIIAEPSMPGYPRITCTDCKTAFCADCSDIWHEGLTCKKWNRLKNKKEKSSVTRRKKKEEQNTKEWMRKNKTIKCKKCNALVQRSEGCNHMTCNCGHEFCWLCGETIMSALGSSTFPLHYTTGPCAGLQMSDIDELSTARKIIRGITAPARYGVILAGLPIYGAAKLLS